MSNVSLFTASLSQLLAFLYRYNCYGGIAAALEVGNRRGFTWIPFWGTPIQEDLDGSFNVSLFSYSRTSSYVSQIGSDRVQSSVDACKFQLYALVPS